MCRIPCHTTCTEISVQSLCSTPADKTFSHGGRAEESPIFVWSASWSPELGQAQTEPANYSLLAMWHQYYHKYTGVVEKHSRNSMYGYSGGNKDHGGDIRKHTNANIKCGSDSGNFTGANKLHVGPSYPEVQRRYNGVYKKLSGVNKSREVVTRRIAASSRGIETPS